jgi:hypothetical protein
MQHLVTEILTERKRGMKIHRTANKFGQIILYPYEIESGCLTRLELHKHIHIASGTEIIAQDRAKKRKPPYVIPTAKLRNCGHRYFNAVMIQLIPFFLIKYLKYYTRVTFHSITGSAIHHEIVKAHTPREFDNRSRSIQHIPQARHVFRVKRHKSPHGFSLSRISATDF